MFILPTSRPATTLHIGMTYFHFSSPLHKMLGFGLLFSRLNIFLGVITCIFPFSPNENFHHPHPLKHIYRRYKKN